MRRFFLLVLVGVSGALDPGPPHGLPNEAIQNKLEMERIRAELAKLDSVAGAPLNSNWGKSPDTSSFSRSLRRGSSYSNRSRSRSTSNTRSSSTRSSYSTSVQQPSVSSRHDKVVYGLVGAVFGAAALGAYQHFR